MKQQLLRRVSLLLALLSVSSLAVSCAGDNTTSDVTDNADGSNAQASTETPDPNDRANIKDNLPDNLDYTGRTFTVFIGSPGEQADFIAGTTEEAGDVVFDAVAARNTAVEERLGVTLSYDVRKDVDGSNIDSFISKLLMAGDTTHDVYSGHQWGLTKLILNGGLVPTEDLEHLDISQPWWWKEYMDELTINESDHYFMVGDFFLHALRSARVTLFNKELYANYFDDADALYDLVLDGKWTIDKMTEYAKAVYVDLNNDGKTDIDDQLGFCAWATMASTDPFVYGTDIDFVKRTEDGGITFTMISDDAVALCEKLVDFFWQDGTFTGITSNEEQYATFSSGRVLFMGNATFASVEGIRDMEAAFGFLPCPKFDENQLNYRTLVHDGGYLGAVNGNSQNLDIAGAVLEALSAETYRSVTPAYYETALKVKYTRDDKSAQMIDMMHDTLMTNFIYAYNYALDNIGLLYRDLITKQSKDYVSTVEKKLKGAESKLEALADAFAGE